MASQRGSQLTYLRRIRYAIASTGLRRALADAALLLLTYRPERDTSFDRKFGTDTAGALAPATLGIADDTRREQAILYLPSPARVTRWMLDHVDIDHRDYTFLDLGCGKGRVLLVASHYPFRQIVGVEISEGLSQIARANADRYRPSGRQCQHIDVVHADAFSVTFPPTNLLIHLYHPFDTAVTSAVLRRLEASLSSNPRKVVVAYLLYASAIDAVVDTFAQFSWLSLIRKENSILGQYEWLVFRST